MAVGEMAIRFRNSEFGMRIWGGIGHRERQLAGGSGQQAEGRRQKTDDR